MAHERAVEVIGVRDLARRTLSDIAAIAAEHHGREATPVQIQDRLVAGGDRALQRFAQRLRERAPIAGP